MEFERVLKESVAKFEGAAYEDKWNNSDLQSPIDSTPNDVSETGGDSSDSDSVEKCIG